MTKPFKYQIDGVKQIEKFKGRALLADEMGLGKTFQVLLWIKNYLYKKPRKGPVVIVCPASLKWNWKREAKMHVDLDSYVLEGNLKTRIKPNNKSKKSIFIINYDILKGNWLEFLASCNPDLVVLDECHFIKSRTAQRTKNTKILCKKAKHVICVSGTPLTNRPAELYPALNLVRPDIYKSFYTFATNYCQLQRKPWGWTYTGAKNLKKLHANLTQDCMIRRTKKEVLKDLPNKTRQVIHIQLKNKKVYDEAINDFATWLVKTYPEKAKKKSSADILVRMGYIRRLIGELKLPSVIEWIDSFLEESEGKLITFGIHTKIVQDGIYAKFKNKAVIVDGKVSGKKRQYAFDKFTNNKNIRLFVGNLQAAGTGWNGTVANTVLFAEMGWTPGEHTQAEDRVNRIGQVKDATCYYLVAADTIEEDFMKMLDTKQKNVTTVLDGNQAEELNLYQQIEDKLYKLGKELSK